MEKVYAFCGVFGASTLKQNDVKKLLSLSEVVEENFYFLLEQQKAFKLKTKIDENS